MQRKWFVFYGVLFLLCYALLFFLHGYIIEHFTFQISLVKSYAVSLCLSALVFLFLFYQVHCAKEVHFIKSFLAIVLCKIILLMVFFGKVFFTKISLSAADKSIILVPYFVSLFFEIFLLIKIPVKK